MGQIPSVASWLETKAECQVKGHRYKPTDLRLCVRCGHIDHKYPVKTRGLKDFEVSDELP